MDMNFLRNLRMKSIFDGLGQQPTQDPFQMNQPMPNPQMQPPVEQPMEQQGVGLNDIANRMAELYHPVTESSDRFNQMIDNYPVMPESSKKRKLGAVALASLSDITGNNKGQGIFDEITGKNQYGRDVTDWKTKITPVQQAASIERQTNSNERQGAYQTITAQLRQEAQDAKIKGDEVKMKIAQQKADAYEFKALHPNMKFDFSGPKVKILDPATGKITVTEFDTGSLSETDKLNLQQKNDLEKIGVQGQNQNTVAETRGWKIGTIPDPNDPSKQIGVRYNEITGAVEPIKANGQNTTVTPTTANSSKQTVDTNAIQQKTRDTLSALDELLDDKTGKLRPEITSAVGASRMFGTQYLPATQARAADAAIKRLKAMLTIEVLGEMKAQSRTGATGFGQLSVRELGVLENAASKLDPTLDEATFTVELKRIKQYLNKVLQPKDGLNPTTTIKKPTAQELIDRYSKPKGGG